MARDGDFVVKYTTKDVIKKIEDEAQARSMSDAHTQEILKQILDQATRTNGRVLELEKRSIGLWISNNIGKSIIVAISIVVTFIKESRDVVIQAILKLFN